MQSNQIVFSFFLYFLILSCSKNYVDEILPEESIFQIAYGDHPSQNLDIYLPPARNGETKLLVFIHGGNWNAGDKSDYSLVLSGLQNNGFAIANVNYRLADAGNNILYTELAADIRSAIDFLILKSSTFTYAPDKIIISGHSAGGHLALYTAYRHNPDHVIKAAISLAGPTELTDDHFILNPDLNGLIENLTGTTFLADSSIWIDASPVSHVTLDVVPTLLQYCALDFVVPVSQGNILFNVLSDTESEHNFITYPLYGHDMGTIFYGGNLPGDVKKDILNFVEIYGN